MTEIIYLNAIYNVSKETEKFKFNGTCNYSSKIDNLNMEVYTINNDYVGNVYYQEFDDRKGNINYTCNIEYFSEIYNTIQSIIEDINAELKKDE